MISVMCAQDRKQQDRNSSDAVSHSSTIDDCSIKSEMIVLVSSLKNVFIVTDYTMKPQGNLNIQRSFNFFKMPNYMRYHIPPFHFIANISRKSHSSQRSFLSGRQRQTCLNRWVTNAYDINRIPGYPNAHLGNHLKRRDWVRNYAPDKRYIPITIKFKFKHLRYVQEMPFSHFTM